MDTKDLKFIDMHCHYDELSLEYLKKNFDSKNQVSLCAATSYASILKLEKIREGNIRNLYFAYGLYPDAILNFTIDKCLEQIENINFNNCLAIGEVGIDNKITKDKEIRKQQEIIFNKQLEIAEKLNKPIIIHTRYATKKILEILTTTKHKKIILHWYSGTESEIETALERGYYLTVRFGYPEIPNIKGNISQLFIETDYPIRYDGKPLELFDIKKSYEVFSKENNIDITDLQKTIQKNFLKLFPHINI